MHPPFNFQKKFNIQLLSKYAYSNNATAARPPQLQRAGRGLEGLLHAGAGEGGGLYVGEGAQPPGQLVPLLPGHGDRLDTATLSPASQ